MPGSEPQVRKDSRLFEELCRALLQRGYAVRFQVNGQSMQPNLNDGDTVVVAPEAVAELRRGDVVLARNAEGLRVHRVTRRNSNSSNVTLQSDTGHAPDAPARHVYGRVCLRKHQRREEVFSAWRTQHAHPTRSFARRLRVAAELRLRRFLPSLFPVISLTACLFFTPVTHAQTADLQLTQTASATAVATNAYTQSLGTATTATWSGGTATFTFPTPLPSGVFPNAALTTTGFTPNVYNVTNVSITSVNYGAGTVSIALASQSMGAASAATWSSAGGGTASFTFPTPLPSQAVVGA